MKKKKLIAEFQARADWARRRTTLPASREELVNDLREQRQLLASAADRIKKEFKQSESRDEAINRLWQSWVEIAELESALKRGMSTSLVYAKIVSRDLKSYAGTLSGFAKSGNKQFFIDLGKCLKGDLKSAQVDRRRCHVASIFCRDPSISIKRALHELRERYGWEMTEDALKMEKMRLAEFPGKRTRNSRDIQSRNS